MISRRSSGRAAARAAGLSQAQFTALLGFEAKAVVARQAASVAPAPAAPKVPEKTPNYDRLSFAEKFMIGERRKQEGK